jgi:uncharacterized protein (TIGR02598 family)
MPSRIYNVITCAIPLENSSCNERYDIYRSNIIPMHPPGAHFYSRSLRAFSLVEVVLALGLCAFVLISLVGLLPVSLNTARDTVEITRRSKAVQQVVSELTQSRFTNVTALSSKEWGFDYEGISTNVSGSGPVYFTIKAQLGNGTLPQINTPTGSPSLIRVKLITSTPRQKPMPGATAVTISDMGY